MKTISLTKGLVTIVDDDVFETLGCYRWCASGARGREYAVRHLSRRIGGTIVLLHREILRAPIGLHVDHINGDQLDNRRANLRFATPSQNQQNERLSRNSTSGFKGVYLDRRRGLWIARVVVARRTKWIGSFAEAAEAARAYDEAAIAAFGDFARLNFPKENACLR